MQKTATNPRQISFFDQRKQNWIKLARQHAREIAQKNGFVTADDIHSVLPLPDLWDHRCMGAVFSKLKGTGCYVKSRRKKCHGRPIQTFVIPDSKNL